MKSEAEQIRALMAIMESVEATMQTENVITAASTEIALRKYMKDENDKALTSRLKNVNDDILERVYDFAVMRASRPRQTDVVVYRLNKIADIAIELLRSRKRPDMHESYYDYDDEQDDLRSEFAREANHLKRLQKYFPGYTPDMTDEEFEERYGLKADSWSFDELQDPDERF
jgi:hypothetical protein